jgi:hypothetical protein
MKARRLIVRALLLISLLSPLGLHAFSSRISTRSCGTVKLSAEPDRPRQVAKSSLYAVLAAPAHRSPARRVQHRLRGKRINLDTSFILPPAPSPVASPPSPTISLNTQHQNGPNPSRGPPALLST